MSSIEWMASWTLNGLLPIHEAAARINSGTTRKKLSGFAADTSAETLEARRVQKRLTDLAYYERKRSK